MPPPTFIMPQPGVTSYLGPWIHVSYGNVTKYMGSTSVHPKQKELVPSVKAESITRTTGRTMKKESDATSDARLAIGKKSHKIHIRARGNMDGCCEGKNAWDDAMRTLIPRILDTNVIKWEGHEPESLNKLRVALNKKFEYMENELSTRGFKNVVKKWFKTKRNKLKARFLAGRIECLMNIEPTHWEKLKVYWNKLETEKKAKQMSNARSKVKNLANVGHTSKARMKGQLVSFYVQMYVVIIICLCNLYYFCMIVVD